VVSDLPALAVEVQGLVKVYRATRNAAAVRALDAIDLAVPRGAMFGLLGPNGAGKSTLINVLAGLVVKTAGLVCVWGNDIDVAPRAARAAIGVVPQEINLDAFFTPREVMEMMAGFYGVPKRERRTMEILGALGLADKADAYARSLSGGMRRRLLVAKALAHSPPVVVLDEPTAGVDVELRHQIWSYLRELNRKGVTIVLTTHYLEEAEELCDTIAIVHRGRVVACEATPELTARLDRKELALTLATDLAAVPPALARFDTELAAPRRLVVRYRPSQTRIDEILAAVGAARLAVLDLTTEEADLEDTFLALTREDGGGADRPTEPPPRFGADPQAEAVARVRTKPLP
jgi:ABC-2 type transport system ATP-binding protein